MRGGIVSVAMQYGNGALQIAAAVVLARLLAPAGFWISRDHHGLDKLCAIADRFWPWRRYNTKKQDNSKPDQQPLFGSAAGLGWRCGDCCCCLQPVDCQDISRTQARAYRMYTAITFVLLGAYQTSTWRFCDERCNLAELPEYRFSARWQELSLPSFIAIGGYGYWALVVRPIANALCVAFGAWLACRWRPGFPVFDNEVKSMVRFGLHVVGFSVTYTVAKAVDRIALGLFYPPALVGYYQNAITLYENSIFSTLAQLHTVGSAALSKLQSNPAALRQKYEAALSALAFFVMPAAAILSVTAEDMTVMLLGEKWRAAGSLLSIIALRGIFQVIEGSQGWLHLSIGRADRWRNWGIVTLVLQIVAVIAGLPFGATGVAVAGVMVSSLIAVTLDQLRGPANRRWRRTRDQGCRLSADWCDCRRSRRLVAPNYHSNLLFQPRPYLFVDRHMYLHLPFYRCGLVPLY